MKKYFFILAALCLLALSYSSKAYGVSATSSGTTVKASVGKYYLSISGFVSPFASIVMTSNSIFLGSTVADPNGNFSIKNIFVNEGFTDFCLEAIDIKRIGDSLTCFKIAPMFSSREIRDIFLPPTLGLSGREIRPNSSILASGYSMPGALVNVNIAKGIILHLTADKSGFYKTQIKNLAVGKYFLFATANYKKRDSEKPSKKLELNSISVVEIIKRNLPLILIVLLILVVIILLIILFRKRLKRKIIELLEKREVFGEGGKVRVPLHHSWFIGY